ncbi:MAG: anhydro-N-acetylmuramic acid kinase [Gammaproteobacteria bacterium]
MTKRYIGLMSGTSADSIDAVLVEFSDHPGIIKSHASPIDQSLRELIFELYFSSENEIDKLGQLDVLLGRSFARAANELIDLAKLSHQDICAIGSHGQTIRHQPDITNPYTLQLGDPNTIAQNTGITTVADFRRRDLAAGGQGAPLVPLFHSYVFHSNALNRVVLNIGGISNITVLPKNDHTNVTGFDTGPGNTLLDAWTQYHRGKNLDKNGDWARTGNVNKLLLNRMLKDPYFSKCPPKSSGRDYFGRPWVENHLKQLDVELPAEDIQATLTELTAASIANAITQFAKETDEVLACGGGVYNLMLMDSLKKRLYDCNLISTSACGFPPDWVEAAAFAWLAKQTLERKPGNLPGVTGASDPVILGGIYQA